MTAKFSIKLTNRSPKQPIKKLPATIELPVDITVEELKVLIARQAGIQDHNRVGLFDPSTNKTLKNRKARLSTEQGVITAGELLVKDLGPQASWRFVFVLEYLGPILFHPAVLAVRPYLYPSAKYTPLSQTQWLTLAMFMAHFLKREYETLFVHKFSANTMPVRNIFKNCFFYWAVSGLLCALQIYQPNSLTAKASNGLLDVIGAAVFLFGEVSNLVVHLNLATLRTTGGTERQIPKGYGFGIVTCPNYMFEVISWIGVTIASRSWTTAVFIFYGGWQMYVWGKGKERAYRKEFPETYKKKKYVMLPGLL